MTGTLLLFFSTALGSILLGYVLKSVVLSRNAATDMQLRTVSKYMKVLAIIMLEPIPVINSFWTLQLISPKLLLMVFFGVVYAWVSMFSAVYIGRRARYDDSTAASFFVSVAFSNFGTFGGLAALLLFGHTGYALVMLAIVLSPIVNFGYGYLVSHNISRGHKAPFQISLKGFSSSPVIYIPLISVCIGLALRVSGVQHTVLLNTLTSILVPVQATVIGIAFGMTLKVRAIRKYLRILASIVMIKYLVIPFIIIPVAMLFGMHQIMDGLPLYIIILLIYMPVAINALIPPVLYGFDLDLVNSAWIVTTLGLCIIFPLLLVLLS